MSFRIHKKNNTFIPVLNQNNLSTNDTGIIFIENLLENNLDTPQNGGYLYVKDGCLYYKIAQGIETKIAL